MNDDYDIAEALAENLRGLRRQRKLTQLALSQSAGIPRATLATLETGSANPTLSVVKAVANALRVPIEELLAAPRGDVVVTKKAQIRSQKKGRGASVRALLPDAVKGVIFERLDIEGGANIKGEPHRPGTREYSVCESGVVDVWVAGSAHRLSPGDVVSFRGDQKHSYRNPKSRRAILYSVIILDA